MGQFSIRVFCVCWVWVCAANAGATDGAVVDSLLGVAEQLGPEAREAALKEAVKADPTGRAMHALARFYLDRGTLDGRQDAGFWIDRAIRREPQNAAYLATDAERLWLSRMRRNAYERAREALELDPDCVGALYWAGRYAVWSWEMAYGTEADAPDRVKASPSGVGTGRTLYSREYLDVDLELGIELLNRALRVDPDHRPSLVVLGLAYYATGQTGLLIPLFEGYRERHPEDRDVHFFIGLGYQMRGDFERAYAAYSDGLARMSEAERRLMQSIFLMEDSKSDALPDTAEIDRFWKGRDPVFLTPVNERLMEQCRRVAYANLRFGDPANRYEGWQTDRGQAYIRYGRPLSRYMIAADADLGLADTPEETVEKMWRGERQYSFTPRREVWAYETFELTFENTNSWESWRFGPARVGLRMIAFEDLVAHIPERYRHPYQYDAPFQVVQFRAGDEKTRVEVYYALPVEKVTHEAAGPGIRSVAVDQGVFLFDAEWDTVRQVVRRVHQMPWVGYEPTRQEVLFAGEQFAVAPGAYHLAGELADRKTGWVGTFHEPVEVRRFGWDSLEVSDLLLARRVVEREDRPPGRERFMVLPNPLGQCDRAGEVSLYFEVYNLSRDAFGGTEYRVTYQMRVVPEEGSVPDRLPEWTTGVAHVSRGDRDWEPLHLALEVGESPPGLWVVRVTVEDLRAGTRAVGMTEFRVMW